MDDLPGGTIGERLRRARRRRFVGRGREIELFSSALAGPEPYSVLFVHGPGGVGKSALLGEFAEAARAAGATPVGLDARTVQPTPSAFLAALGPLGAAAGRRVVMVDTYEQLGPLDGWVRERFVPDLPADALVVIAGRHPPAAWVSDPGWRDLLKVVPLRNLRPDDTRDYLRIEGIPDGLHEQVLEMTHGHPLTLSLLVEVLGREHPAVPRELADAPDVVRALLGRVIEAAPGPRHRAALEVSAHARFTTEELLRAALGGEDAHELFGWLRTQSFMDEGPQGVYPHDVARDILDADLRWRDPAGYADLHRRLRAHLLGRRLLAGADERERARATADGLFLSRSHPVVRAYFELATSEEAYTDVLRPGDAETVVDMTQRYQGAEQAALAAYWLERQPRAFRVVRTVAGERIGYGAYLALHEADEADLRRDPGVRAMWEYARRHGPPRPGEPMMGWRLFVDSEPHRLPSRCETLVRLWHGQEAISRSTCSWDFVGGLDPARDHWKPLFEHYDFHLAAEARYEIGGRPYEVYAHDWRRVGVEEWLELVAARELGAPVAPPADELVLSEPEFADAVRTALRDLHSPDRLAGNPLLRSRLAGGPGPPAETLRELIVEAADSLRADPRDEGLYRVIDRTFLRPAPTQERAAELLGLPFSTYRRHRNKGVRRIVGWLWRRELSGESGHRLDSDRPGG